MKFCGSGNLWHLLGTLLSMATRGTLRHGLLVTLKVPWKAHGWQSSSSFGHLWSLASSMFMWVQLGALHRGLLVSLKVPWKNTHDEVLAICLWKL